MKMMRKLTRYAIPASFVAGTILLASCDGNNSKPPEPTPDAQFEVMIINATANQPLSPPAVQLFDSAYYAWEIGAPASNGLEVLAESGSPADFVAEASAVDSDMGSAVVMPGASVMLSVMAPADGELNLSVATMLVNTNDAFTGLTNWNVMDLAAGESKTMMAPVYDAGTEINSESAASIPGPAAGGEGFNAARDDHGYVTRHPGVVSMHDGLTSSVLDQSHRFDNGAMIVKVTRMQ